MEIVIGIVAVVLALAFLEVVFNKINNWSSSINWAKFLGIFIVGSILLAVIFSYTAEGVLVIVGFYTALLIISLFFGLFKNDASNQSYNEITRNDDSHQQGLYQGKIKVAKNLLEIMDDETIANKTELSVDEIKSLRLKS